jgi:hypothetical protein
MLKFTAKAGQLLKAILNGAEFFSDDRAHGPARPVLLQVDQGRDLGEAEPSALRRLDEPQSP